jgi:hypothetical protein
MKLPTVFSLLTLLVTISYQMLCATLQQDSLVYSHVQQSCIREVGPCILILRCGPTIVKEYVVRQMMVGTWIPDMLNTKQEHVSVLLKMLLIYIVFRYSTCTLFVCEFHSSCFSWIFLLLLHGIWRWSPFKWGSSYFSMEISARPLSLSWFCVDPLYNFILLRAKKERSADVVVDGIVAVSL